MDQTNIRRIITTIAIFLLSVEIYLHVGFAEESFCDPYLIPRDDHPYGYRLRGDRCEGIYVKQVSSTVLSLVSLTGLTGDVIVNQQNQLLIEWKLAKDREIRLRAYGIKPRLYYRMDTVRPRNSTSYLWPTDVLSALGINKDNIGLVAWVFDSNVDNNKKVYLPLQIGDANKGFNSNTYELGLLPGRELAELFLSVASADSDGNPKSYLMEEVALEYGYYPPGRIVKIPIENLKSSGMHYVQIGAILREGGAMTIDFLFYHSTE